MIGTCATCGAKMSHPTIQGISDQLWQHHATAHRGEPLPALTQLPAVSWHRTALDAIHTLAATGRPFVIADVIELGVGDPANPRTDWPKVTAEAQALGWIEPHGYAQSTRPTAKSSAVRQWIGTYAAKRGAA